jgi:hypothetical protein
MLGLAGASSSIFSRGAVRSTAEVARFVFPIGWALVCDVTPTLPPSVGVASALVLRFDVERRELTGRPRSRESLALLRESLFRLTLSQIRFFNIFEF